MTDRLAANQIVSGRYQILSVIGEGGMGLVYQVNQIFLNKQFAFKVIKKAALSDIVVRRFQQEARAAFALKHENIIGVNDFGILDDDTPFLVMELVSGQTLGQRIKRGGRLHLDEALPIFIQICNGLDFAHKHGVVHRDVKPNNIMLVPGSPSQPAPVVKIVDFGIAKFAGHEEGEIQALTRTGEIFGSPLYMSPEQCLGSRIDHRSDIYSLGCVFFEALTGLPPFVGENALSTMMKHQGENHATLSEASLGLTFSRSLEDIIKRMLYKAPADRYQSLEQVAADLHSLQVGTDISRSNVAPHLVSTTSGRDNHTISMTKTKFVTSLAAVALASVSVAALLFSGFQINKQQPSLTLNRALHSGENITGKTDEQVMPATVETEVDADETEFKPFTDEELDTRFIHPGKSPAEFLHVANRKITNHVLERISQIKTIFEVTFTDCSIETAGLAHFAKMKLLRNLSLSGSNVNDDCVKYLLACKKLSYLNINATNITDVGLRTLIQMPSLTTLAASQLKITNKAISAPNPGLTCIELKNDSKISNEALPAIVGLNLYELELDWTGVNDEGLKLLTKIKSLTQVGLTGTGVTLAGLRNLYNNLPKLTRLDLSSGPSLSKSDIAAFKHETEKRIEILVHDKSSEEGEVK